MPRSFSSRLVAWQKTHGRHDLPWQNTRDTYRVWVAEIMLQQTQVATAIPYFQRFITQFPDIAALARASQDEVLRLWSGLGYYGRARNLHSAAQLVMTRHGGDMPTDFDALRQLPGIGQSTAAAISVFAAGKRHAILDGNVKRVLCRHFGIEGYPGDKAIENKLWSLAERRLPKKGIRSYTQGLMDLGAAICIRRNPLCEHCPVNSSCIARQQKRTQDLPYPRLKKAQPVKHTKMLVLSRQREIFLQKRPAKGIWEGLWSLPEIGVRADAKDYCRKKLGLRVKQQQALPRFEHGLSHFKLIITPVLLEVEQKQNTSEFAGLWLDKGEVLQAALPAPVRKLLRPLV